MSEVYSTPVHDSPEPQEVSVDILAQEELEGMQSRLSALADAGTVADHVVTSFVAALPSSCVRLRRTPPNPPSLFLRVYDFSAVV